MRERILLLWRLLFHRVKCKKCGRPLLNRKSRELGYGPECARGCKASIEREKLLRAGQTEFFTDDK